MLLAAGRSFDPNKQGLTYIDDPAAAMHMRLFLVSAGYVAPNTLLLIS